MIMNRHTKGFTLVELLVVISIISLLASAFLVKVNTARAKARDVRKQEEIHGVRNALELFFTSTGKMPKNYNCSGSSCFVAKEDLANPDNPTTAGGIAYNKSMQELVTAGVIEEIPHSPGVTPYYYYNYGSGNGVIFATTLEVIDPPETSTRCDFTSDDTTISGGYIGGPGTINTQFMPINNGNNCVYDTVGEPTGPCTLTETEDVTGGICIYLINGVAQEGPCNQSSPEGSICTGDGDNFCACSQY